MTSGSRESVIEPRWDADGSLYFLSDRSNWWNLYRSRITRSAPYLDRGRNRQSAVDTRTVQLRSHRRGRAVVRYTVAARDKLGVVDLPGPESSPLWICRSWACRTFSSSRAGHRYRRRRVRKAEAALVAFDSQPGGHHILRAPGSVKLDPAFISVAEPIEFPTAGGLTAHAFYYPPTNPEASALRGREAAPRRESAWRSDESFKARIRARRPSIGPRVVSRCWMSTTAAAVALDVPTVSVSTGSGASSTSAMSSAAVKYLIDSGRIDGNAPPSEAAAPAGFTVFAALAFHDVFRAGANYYGVSDLEALARDTHKFEARYLDRLVAPLPQGRESTRRARPFATWRVSRRRSSRFRERTTKWSHRISHARLSRP